MIAKRKRGWRWNPAFGAVGLVLLFCFFGCAADTVTRTSLNRALLDQESIKRVAVLSFENPPDDFQAGSHISKLFESYLLQTNLYQIAERGEIEKVLKERGFGKTSELDKATLRQLGELLQVDGLVLGAVSQYNRFNFGFTARLVSIKSGLILWSVSQTGGMLTRPLSQVANETVQAAVKDLQMKIR
jgi:curli biogenesis system outer membrane secretion channel CsgG